MDIVVHHAELSELAGRLFYVTTIEYPPDKPLPEGELHKCAARLTPHDRFETLAAEYGIDPDAPEGWDELLELWAYAHETGLTEEEELADPDSIYNAPTVEHARKARLNRIRERRGKGRLRGVKGYSGRALLTNAQGVDNSGEEDPLEFIKRTAPMRREHLLIKTESVRRERNRMRALRQGVGAAGRGVYEHDEGQGPRRGMKLYQEESAEELAVRLLGSPPPPRLPDAEAAEPPSFLSGGMAG